MANEKHFIDTIDMKAAFEKATTKCRCLNLFATVLKGELKQGIHETFTEPNSQTSKSF